MLTLQQQRARHALAQVRAAQAKLGTKERKEFRAHTQGLPYMIHVNGLGQAYAFYLSKREKPSYRAICGTLAAWLLAEGNPCHGGQGGGNNDPEWLLEALVGGDQRRYLSAQAEAIAYMGWVKRFADAFLVEDKPREEEPPCQPQA